MFKVVAGFTCRVDTSSIWWIRMLILLGGLLMAAVFMAKIIRSKRLADKIIYAVIGTISVPVSVGFFYAVIIGC